MKRIELGFLVACALATAQCGHSADSTIPDDRVAPAAASAVSDAPAAVRVSVEGMPIVGNPAAQVTVVMFSDYECPYCAKADKILTRLRSELGDDIRIALAMRPLPMHEHADTAARALLAAAAQGKAEAMHKALFENRAALDDAAIAAAAHAAGLDEEAFDRDRHGPEVGASMDRAAALATALGVEGTPTFFINGRRITGAQPYEQFLQLATEERAKAHGRVYATLLNELPAYVAGPPEPHENDAIVDVAVDGAPLRGPASAPVTIAMFSDFECAYCVKAEATLKTLQAKYPGKLNIAFLHRPLPIHEHARLAAKASLAADEQGRFWEYHDILIQHRDALERPQLESYALQAGLDARRFDHDLDDPQLDARLDQDLEQATRLDVKGTPTFFVNGRRITGAQPQSVFASAVDQALAKR